MTPWEWLPRPIRSHARRSCISPPAAWAESSATANCREAGPEQIIETYYSLAVFSFGHITADYQFVNNPAYNRQRGPVSVFALRLHAEF